MSHLIRRHSLCPDPKPHPEQKKGAEEAIEPELSSSFHSSNNSHISGEPPCRHHPHHYHHRCRRRRSRNRNRGQGGEGGGVVSGVFMGCWAGNRAATPRDQIFWRFLTIDVVDFSYDAVMLALDDAVVSNILCLFNYQLLGGRLRTRWTRLPRSFTVSMTF